MSAATAVPTPDRGGFLPEERDRIRRLATTPLYERLHGWERKCVLCGKVLKRHPFALHSHGEMHERRREAIGSGTEYFVAPTSAQIAAAEDRARRLIELRAIVRPLAKVSAEARGRVHALEKEAIRTVRFAVDAAYVDRVHAELVAADTDLQAAEQALMDAMSPYVDVRGLFTMGDLSGGGSE